jgi:glycyl-tRNA synthetase
VTVDYRSLEDDTVTLRDRDSTAQLRVPAGELAGLLAALRGGEESFDALADEYERAE